MYDRQSDRRFEIEHPDFGGLAFSINSLLNQLMGVQEDDTDEQGRPSRVPAATPQKLQEAFAVEPTRVEQAPSAADILRMEPEDQYFSRLFGEYIAARKSVGEPTEHITQDAFVQKIRGLQTDSADKGKVVRYKVELRGKEVTLIAVPLG